MATLWQSERFEVTGIVQGVGFRPFVYRLATELGLTGQVGNDSARVFIDVAGPQASLDTFAARLVVEAPPLARVEAVARRRTFGSTASEFSIVESRAVSGERTLISPDVAVCDGCVEELFDPADRRYRHPFITCTNYGPRFTIIKSLPYDRPNTTMGGFEMCPSCAAEYRDPLDRRYHAQPIGCLGCGPELTLISDDVAEYSGETAIDRTIGALGSGQILAIKGLGGFHLACDATSDSSVGLLRARKGRPDKPFAIMACSLDHAAEFAHISEAETVRLLSPARPVVLLRARRRHGLSQWVAPGSPLVGIMLPHTPLQHLLLAGRVSPLVMTSGNRAGEPICFRDDQVVERLGPLTDAILTHDRAIQVPCDDSVVRLVGGRLLPVRRARGYAPVPVTFKGARRQVLAVGGDLKNTFCVSSAEHAWVSQHIGDMENLETLAAFEVLVEQFLAMYAVCPDVVAADLHPAYHSSRWARTNYPGRVVEIQHHHAHVAAVMAEHQLDPVEPVIGFAFDGTGYGDDGTMWGGEVMIADATRYERAAHLSAVPLPGGDAAIRNPYRVALAHLFSAGLDWDSRLAPVSILDDTELALLHRQLTRGVACVPTTSMGRLFDAVASLLGLRHRVSFEAQAAIDLEFAAEAGRSRPSYQFSTDGPLVDPTPVLRSIVTDLLCGVTAADIALGFHHAVADLVLELAGRIRDTYGLDTVALSGGVFQNALLTNLCIELLSGDGFEPLTHSLVPPNDGGLALGQAFIGAHQP